MLPRRSGVERWVHPEVGELRLAYETLTLPDDQRLVVYLPADEATSTTSPDVNPARCARSPADADRPGHPRPAEDVGVAGGSCH